MMIIMEHLPSHQILFSSFVAHRPEELTFTSYPRWAGAVPRVYLDGVRWYFPLFPREVLMAGKPHGWKVAGQDLKPSLLNSRT